MEITVCIKQVPRQAEIRWEEGRWSFARQGVPGLINPQDLEALEMALQLKETHGGKITVLSMGPAQAEESLMEALAMGADRAVLISDPALAGSDTLATSTVLAAGLRKFQPKPHIILCGSRSSDSDTGQVGPQISEELELPYAGYALEVEIKQEHAYVLRRLDRRVQRLRMSLPAVVGMLRAPRRPRDIPLGAIGEAFETKERLRWNLQDLGLKPEEVGLKGSATKVVDIREPSHGRQGRILALPPHQAVEMILEVLRSRHLIS
jgi:electron transfer flavoprotein beta subunit